MGKKIENATIINLLDCESFGKKLRYIFLDKDFLHTCVEELLQTGSGGNNL